MMGYTSFELYKILKDIKNLKELGKFITILNPYKDCKEIRLLLNIARDKMNNTTTPND